jgi:hypothetical protein
MLPSFCRTYLEDDFIFCLDISAGLSLQASRLSSLQEQFQAPVGNKTNVHGGKTG